MNRVNWLITAYFSALAVIGFTLGGVIGYTTLNRQFDIKHLFQVANQAETVEQELETADEVKTQPPAEVVFGEQKKLAEIADQYRPEDPFTPCKPQPQCFDDWRFEDVRFVASGESVFYRLVEPAAESPGRRVLMKNNNTIKAIAGSGGYHDERIILSPDGSHWASWLHEGGSIILLVDGIEKLKVADVKESVRVDAAIQQSFFLPVSNDFVYWWSANWKHPQPQDDVVHVGEKTVGLPNTWINEITLGGYDEVALQVNEQVDQQKYVAALCESGIPEKDCRMLQEYAQIMTNNCAGYEECYPSLEKWFSEDTIRQALLNKYYGEYYPLDLDERGLIQYIVLVDKDGNILKKGKPIPFGYKKLQEDFAVSNEGDIYYVTSKSGSVENSIDIELVVEKFTGDTAVLYKATESNVDLFGPPRITPYFDAERGAMVALTSKINGAETLVVNDQIVARYDGFNAFSFSPDGNHLIFGAFKSESDQQGVLVVDGQERDWPQNITYFTINNDGIPIYKVEENISGVKKSMLVVGDKRGNPVDHIYSFDSIRIDGKRIGYGARIGNELWWMVEEIK